MFDLGWSEMAVIGLLALLVIGPKDLPGVMRQIGKYMRKARGLAREFQGHFDDMAREADLDDARKAVNAARNFDVEKMAESAIDPDGEILKDARDLKSTVEADAPEPKAEDKAAKASSPTDSTILAEPAQPEPAPEPTPEPEPVPRRRRPASRRRVGVTRRT